MNTETIPVDRMLKNGAKSAGKQLTKQGALFVAKAVAPAEAANGLAELTSILCDAVLKGVDAIAPSNVAKAYMWLTTGETPEDTYKRTRKAIQDGYQRSIEHLRTAKTGLEQQKKAVYGQ